MKKEGKFDISESDVEKIFSDTEYSYLLEDVIEEIKKLGYSNPGTTILKAIEDEILYIDDIENDGSVYISTVDISDEDMCEYDLVIS